MTVTVNLIPRHADETRPADSYGTADSWRLEGTGALLVLAGADAVAAYPAGEWRSVRREPAAAQTAPRREVALVAVSRDDAEEWRASRRGREAIGDGETVRVLAVTYGPAQAEGLRVLRAYATPAAALHPRCGELLEVLDRSARTAAHTPEA